MPTSTHQEKNFEWAALDVSSGVKMIEKGAKGLGLNEGMNVKALPPGLVMTTVDLFPKTATISPSSGPPNFSMTLILSGHVAFIKRSCCI